MTQNVDDANPPKNPGRRGEGYFKVNSTVEDEPTKRASVIDKRDLVTGELHLRGIEAGSGVSIDVVDYDEDRYRTTERKIRISATGSGPSGNDVVQPYNAPITSNGQTSFSLPSGTTSIQIITINGIESTDFSFTLGPPTLYINDVALGYQIESDDEILVFYRK